MSFLKENPGFEGGQDRDRSHLFRSVEGALGPNRSIEIQ